MSKHVFDLHERATHELVADQLRTLADQFAAGEISLSYEDWRAPTVVVDPVDVVVDLVRKHDHVELEIRLRWPLTATTGGR